MCNIFSLYNGFAVTEAQGNNAFSFEQRKNRMIYVAPLIRGDLNDLSVSDQIAFSEIVESEEYNFSGLERFVHCSCQGKDCFIFDNHNHAFFFWAWAVKNGIFRPGAALVHVDQHSDMRKPRIFLSKDELNDLKKVFDYTNYSLNVGNFIQPALQAGIFSTIDLIDSSLSFDKTFSGPIVLDVDIDIFSRDMAYINDDLKIRKIREYASQADFITVASSPFFIDQNTAIARIKEIFWE